jgi:hypothetical protein
MTLDFESKLLLLSDLIQLLAITETLKLLQLILASNMQADDK